MQEIALFFVWLIGLFGLIGVVMAAVVRLVQRDTTAYDKEFTWKAFSQPSPDEEEPGRKPS
jgi:hypothetical protein